MTTATLTLSEFLLARLAEDEAVARAAKPGPWHWEGDKGHHGSWYLATAEPAPEQPEGPGYDPEAWSAWSQACARRTVADGTACDETGAQVDIEDADAEHIARHDPARVLAEVDAKRLVVGLYLMAVGHRDTETNAATRLFAEQSCDDLQQVVRLLALPYSSHPDFREEWRP